MLARDREKVPDDGTRLFLSKLNPTRNGQATPMGVRLLQLDSRAP
ncbi:MAG: hypothetical protein ACREMY_00055 [bacterium]